MVRRTRDRTPPCPQAAKEGKGRKGRRKRIEESPTRARKAKAIESNVQDPTRSRIVHERTRRPPDEPIDRPAGRPQTTGAATATAQVRHAATVRRTSPVHDETRAHLMPPLAIDREVDRHWRWPAEWIGTRRDGTVALLFSLAAGWRWVGAYAAVVPGGRAAGATAGGLCLWPSPCAIIVGRATAATAYTRAGTAAGCGRVDQWRA